MTEGTPSADRSAVTDSIAKSAAVAPLAPTEMYIRMPTRLTFVTSTPSAGPATGGPCGGETIVSVSAPAAVATRVRDFSTSGPAVGNWRSTPTLVLSFGPACSQLQDYLKRVRRARVQQSPTRRSDDVLTRPRSSNDGMTRPSISRLNFVEAAHWPSSCPSVAAHQRCGQNLHRQRDTGNSHTTVSEIVTMDPRRTNLSSRVRWAPSTSPRWHSIRVTT